ncbi:MAG TPA: iron-containing alcohol dehydrogenase [Stellaceae bacterium]|jgi:maleylacetate reductase|nr:iron-containing alcohol dehydrogenase [Stellaceae bacterium]
MLTGTYRFPAMESIIYGRPFAEALTEQVEQSGANAVFLLASGTLARETNMIGEIREALGNRVAGVHPRIGAHTPRVDVVDAANAARAAGCDLLVTLGGGSITDAAKMVAFCLGNHIDAPAQLDDYRAVVGPDGKSLRPESLAPSVRTITIPTTLSAGEYSASAGCTDTERNVKESFGHPLMVPRTVILDPRATLHTPEWLFLSTGIRAVDHAVEDICSPLCQPISESASFHALKLLARGLAGVKADPLDLDARLDCQLGAWMSMVGSQTGVPKGASHGIGHVLGGTAHVPHGYTSCVMLPHVLRFNLPENAARQALVSEAMGSPNQPAADVVAALIAGLGLPSRLSDVGVRVDQLGRIAELSMHDRWIHTNPRKIDGPLVIREILDAAY